MVGVLGTYRIRGMQGRGQVIKYAFEIPYEELAILNAQNEWAVEPGSFIISVGGSSRKEDLSLSIRVNVTD